LACALGAAALAFPSYLGAFDLGIDPSDRQFTL
jgi:hypothetical protein